VILGVSKALEIEVPKEIVKTATVFGGGIGKSGCLCGALAGAIILIGYLSSKSEKEASEFFHIFKGKFKSSCCRVLRKEMDFKDPNLKEHCAKITEETAGLLTKFLMGDKG
jgi:C_GCAxxG_C_C family probable redox protein